MQNEKVENARNLMDQVNYYIADVMKEINKRKKHLNTDQKITIDLAPVEKILHFVQSKTKKAMNYLDE
jgi:hypothetical protein